MINGLLSMVYGLVTCGEERRGQMDCLILLSIAGTEPGIGKSPSRPLLTYLSRCPRLVGVKSDSIRTSVDLPRDLHRRLHEMAARRGCSARKLILASIEHAVEQNEPVKRRRRLSLDPPLIPPTGQKIDLTNEQLYDLIEFP